MPDGIKSDRVAGLFAVTAGLVMFGLSYNIQFNPNQLTLSARFFPFILSGAMLCLGLGLCLRPGPVMLRKVWSALANLQGAEVVGLVLLYFLSFRYLDFRLGAFSFMLLVMLALGARRPWELLLMPALVSGGIYAIFRYGFSVLLPVWG